MMSASQVRIFHFYLFSSTCVRSVYLPADMIYILGLLFTIRISLIHVEGSSSHVIYCIKIYRLWSCEGRHHCVIDCIGTPVSKIKANMFQTSLLQCRSLFPECYLPYKIYYWIYDNMSKKGGCNSNTLLVHLRSPPVFEGLVLFSF